MFGLYISSLLISSTSISFLSNTFVIAELFCNVGDQQYLHKFEYYQTYIVHEIPTQATECLIRLKDKLGNLYTRQIDIK